MNKEKAICHEEARLLVNQVNIKGFILPEIIRKDLHDYIDQQESTPTLDDAIKVIYDTIDKINADIRNKRIFIPVADCQKQICENILSALKGLKEGK